MNTDCSDHRDDAPRGGNRRLLATDEGLMQNRTRGGQFFDPKDDTVTTHHHRPSRPEDGRWNILGPAGRLPEPGRPPEPDEDAEVKWDHHYYLTFQDRGGGYCEIE